MDRRGSIDANAAAPRIVLERSALDCLVQLIEALDQGDGVEEALADAVLNSRRGGSPLVLTRPSGAAIRRMDIGSTGYIGNSHLVADIERLS